MRVPAERQPGAAQASGVNLRPRGQDVQAAFVVLDVQRHQVDAEQQRAHEVDVAAVALPVAAEAFGAFAESNRVRCQHHMSALGVAAGKAAVNVGTVVTRHQLVLAVPVAVQRQDSRGRLPG